MKSLKADWWCKYISNRYTNICVTTNGCFLLLFLMLKLEAEFKVEWFHFLGRMWKSQQKSYLYKGERILTAIILAWCERSCKNFLWCKAEFRETKILADCAACWLLSVQIYTCEKTTREDATPESQLQNANTTHSTESNKLRQEKTHRYTATAFIQQTLHKN